MSDPEPLQDALANSPLLLTPEEAAIVLSVGRSTVIALMEAGHLRPVHIGRNCRLSRAELERYVRQLATRPQAVRTPTDESEAARSSRRRRGSA
jgi:excisionase family DNA binding protein